jgi:competence protein ComEC
MDILRFPLVKVTFWFVIGIVANHYLKQNPIDVIVALIASFGILCTASLLAKKDFRQKGYFGTTLYLVCFFAGAATLAVHDFETQKDNYIHFVNGNQSHVLKATLREKFKNSPSGEKYVAIVKWIDGKKVSGKILLHFRNKKAHHFRIGTSLIAKGFIIRNKPPLNPDQFDYGKYLDNKAIPAQLFLDDSRFRICSEVEKNIWFYADGLRNTIISNLAKKGFGNEALQVLNALILGQQQEISADIVKDYQYAGAVHILSVSGLHVGFILLFINFILRPLPKTRYGNFIRLVTVIFCLWTFAIVAGLSPSVVRSATMFSFVAMGMHLRRSANIFHTLVVSIWLILLFEPSFLFDVGFQLSYAALFFILWLQPLFAGMWSPKSRIFKYLWDVLTVSFAAQIGAFPLSIYYFHQFPGLFFVTNLVVIPFLSVIMILGVLVMAMASYNFVPHFPAMALEYCIMLLNKIINMIASFEQFIIRDIPFNFQMMAALYGLIFGIFIWLKKPSFGKLVFALMGIIIFQLSYFGTFWKTKNSEEFVVFNIRKKTLLVEKKGNKIHAYGDILPPMKNYAMAHFSHVEKKSAVANTYWFGDKRILVIDKATVYPMTKPDILILTGSPKINLERYLENHQPDMVVADGSNFKSYAAKWKQTCQKQKIPFHDTNEKGFFGLKK